MYPDIEQNARTLKLSGFNTFIFRRNVPSTDLFQVQIHLVNGELVRSMGHYKNNNLVDIKDLPHGLYVVRISNANKVFVCKVLH